MGCSTAGEISNKKFSELSFSICSVKLEKARYKKCSYDINEVGNSFNVGQSIAKSLRADSLKHIFILSDGVAVNGTHLLDGINSIIAPEVNVSGGLAGDGAAFGKAACLDCFERFSIKKGDATLVMPKP